MASNFKMDCWADRHCLYNTRFAIVTNLLRNKYTSAERAALLRIVNYVATCILVTGNCSARILVGRTNPRYRWVNKDSITISIGMERGDFIFEVNLVTLSPVFYPEFELTDDVKGEVDLILSYMKSVREGAICR